MTKLFKSVTTISIHTAFGRLLGYIRETIFLHYMGAQAAYDVYSMITKVSSVFRRLFAEGAFNAAFVPIFTGLMKDNENKRAVAFARKAMYYTLLLIIPLLTLAHFFPEYVVSFLASGFRDDPAKFAWSVDLVQIIFPYIGIILAAAILGGVLNALHHFGATAATQSIGNISIIAGFFMAFTTSKTLAHAAAWGILFSAVIQFIWLFFIVAKEGYVIYPKTTSEYLSTRDFLKKLLPGMLGTGVVQINILVNIMFASHLPTGGVSYVQISERTNQLPLSMIAVAMGTALLPLMTRQLKEGRKAEAMETQQKAIELANYITFPFTAFIMIFAPIIMGVMYYWSVDSKLQPTQVGDISATMIAFGAGLPAYIYLKIFSSTFYANRRVVEPLLGAVIAIILNVLVCYYSITTLNESGVGHIGVAAASSLSAWGSSLFMGYIAYKRLLFSPNQEFRNALFKNLGAVAIVVPLLLVVKSFLMPYMLATNKITKILLMLAMLSVTFFPYKYIARAFKLKKGM